MSQTKLRVHIRSADQQIADHVTDLLATLAKAAGARIAGPIPLPVKILRYTVLSGQGKPRRPVEMRVFRRHFDVIEPSSAAIAAIVTADIPASADVLLDDRSS
jgi:small subunit ribosomal protein S10